MRYAFKERRAADSHPLPSRTRLGTSGVGTRSRARLWMAWSGARAKMLSSSVSYADHLRSASEVLRGASAAARHLKQHEHQIDLDLERTFPNHAEFRRFQDDRLSADRAPGGPCASTSGATNDAANDETTKPSRNENENSSRLGGSKLEPLRRVLLALAHAVPDVGYTQGMNFVCGWCLLVLDKDGGLGSLDKDAAKHALEECAFWLMRAVLEDVLPGYFDPGLAALRFDLDALDDDFLAVAPDAHAALEKAGCQLRCFTPRWLLCIMVGTAPTAATLRVWDALLLDAPGGGGALAYSKAMPSLRFRPRDVLRRCALALLTEPGRARAIAVAPGAAEAVESIRSAGRGVADLQAFLRRVRDLAPGARPAGLRAALGSTAAALATAAAAAAKPVSARLGSAAASRIPARRNAADVKTPPRAGAPDAASAPPALTPFGNLLSVMRSAPARELAKPRALRWGPERPGGNREHGEDGNDDVAGRGSKRRNARVSRSGRENRDGVEMDGGCGATPSRRRVTGVDAMASWASPPSLRSPIRAAVGYQHEPSLATRSPLARMR